MGRRRKIRSPNVSPDHRSVDDRRHSLPPVEIHLLEDRAAAQSHEIQTLFHDNQRLAAGHVELRQDLDSAKQEIGRLSASASSVKAERNARVCEIQERSLKLEGEARSIERLKEELDRLRAEVNGMRAEREELLERARVIDLELASTRPESQQLSGIRTEIEFMKKENKRGRNAVAYEKEIQSYNLKLSDAMEQHLISMRHEEEQLRSQLANAEKRAAAAATAAYSAPTAAYSAPTAAYSAPTAAYSAPTAPFPGSAAAFPAPAAAFPAPFSAPPAPFSAPAAPFPAQYPTPAAPFPAQYPAPYPWPGYAAHPMNFDGGYSFYDPYAVPHPQSNYNAYYGPEAGLHWPAQAPYYFQGQHNT